MTILFTLVPQIEFLKLDGKVFDRIKLFKFENFNEIYEYFNQNIHENKSFTRPSRPYQDEYTDQTRELVGKLYKDDLDFFNYSF